MSDVESEVNDAAENPNPESDFVANGAEQNAAETEVELNENEIEANENINSNNERINASFDAQPPENLDQLQAPSNQVDEDDDKFHERNEEENAPGLAAEGDEYQQQEGAEIDGDNDLNNSNSLAAEDEQFLVQDSAACDSSYKPESDFKVVDDHEAAASTEGGVRENGRTLHSAERTESSAQLEDYGAGAQNDIFVQQIDSTEDDRNDGGASSSAVESFLVPESEVGENLSNSGANEPVLENEPTESDQEGEHENAIAIPTHYHAPVNTGHGVESPEIGASYAFAQESPSNVAGIDESVHNLDEPVLEDEISVIASGQEPLTDSYEPECDQSELEASENPSSQSRIETSDIAGIREVVPSSQVESETVGVDPNPSANCQESTPIDKINGTCNLQVSDSSKDMGAIPKHRKLSESKSSGTCTVSGDKMSGDLAEDELLSELDATLTSKRPNMSSSLKGDKEMNECATGSMTKIMENGHSEAGNPVGCEQCVRSNIQCSFRNSSAPSVSKSDSHALKETKTQLKQAKQMLLDRECEINR